MAKAKHIKISVEEMEKRLREGDATLMSALLSTPIVVTLSDSYLKTGQELTDRNDTF